MANSKAKTALSRGIDALLHWIGHGREPLDLSGLDLSGQDLRWTNFAGANLAGVNFQRSLLTGCYFGPGMFRKDPPHVSVGETPVNLEATDFSGAILLAATFNYPNIAEAVFEDSYLGLANFRSTHFVDNNLVRAKFVNTAFSSCRFDHGVRLDGAKHFGPSHLDVHTLRNSPELPTEFIVQTGIELHEYEIPVLEAHGHQGNRSIARERVSCFLSHSSQDQDFCDALYRSMVGSGIRVWYAPEDMKGGQHISSQIDEAINSTSRTIIVLSENSINSEWVKNEILRAFRRENNLRNKVLFPISLLPPEELKNWEFLDTDSGVDLAGYLRSFFIPDFSIWNDRQKFYSAVQRLKSDLET